MKAQVRGRRPRTGAVHEQPPGSCASRRSRRKPRRHELEGAPDRSTTEQPRVNRRLRRHFPHQTLMRKVGHRLLNRLATYILWPEVESSGWRALARSFVSHTWHATAGRKCCPTHEAARMPHPCDTDTLVKALQDGRICATQDVTD